MADLSGRAAVSCRDTDWQIPTCETVILRPRSARHALVIPVWNEGERLGRQLARLRPYLHLVDVVIADAPSSDGSTDVERLREAGVHALTTLKEPGGMSSSLRTGLAYALRAGFDSVVEMDGNDKDDPAAIPSFVEELERGTDFVQGSRYVHGGRGINTPWERDLLIRFVHAPVFSVICRHRFTDSTNGFRAYGRRLLCHDRVRPFRHSFTGYELVYYLAWAACHRGLTVREVPVTRAYPKGAVPTKIQGLGRYWLMLKPLLMLGLGRY